MLTIEEIRHANLHLLAARGHSQAELGRALDIDRRQVNQWFVKPPLRDLSSDYARAIEEKLSLARGILDHPQLGELAPHPVRLDRDILSNAIAIAMDSPHELTAEAIINAYVLLLERAAPPLPEGMPPPKPKGPKGNVAVEGRDPGTVENPRRKDGPRKT